MQHNYHTFRFSGATMTRARYYQPNLSIWLSVDPMADKYPSTSPYTYCGDNPVRLVDPDGRTVVIPDEEDKKFINQLIDPNSKNYSAHFHAIYNELDEQSDHIYTFESWNYDVNRIGFEEGKYENYGNGTSIINFSKDDSPMVTDPLVGASPFRNLFEETYHAYQDKHGLLNNSCINEAEAWKFAATAPGTNNMYFDNRSQIFVTTLMGRIQKASVIEIAVGFKFGFSSTETSVGVDYGIYADFPLGIKRKTNPFLPNLFNR